MEQMFQLRIEIPEQADTVCVEEIQQALQDWAEELPRLCGLPINVTLTEVNDE